MPSTQRLVYLLSLLGIVYGQTTCENYGNVNGSECSCPPGFGGTACSQPGCNGTIFEGSQRPVATLSSGTPSLSNLTASGCTCQSGWTGTGCNVCQSASACQSGYSASGYSQPGTNTSVDGTGQSQNNTFVCNTATRVYAASEMSCEVINPTLQAVYPLSATLNILRTLQPSLTPIPNTTAFGSQNTVFGQLFYAGVEQFYCKADSCTQDLVSEGTGSAVWNCQNLACTCRPGTTFCGAVPTTNLTATINGLDGTLGISCEPPNSTTNTAQCDFKQSVLQSLFGSSGLSLSGCSFGECVRQSVIDETGSSGNSSSGSSSSGSSLNGGVIAGLAVVGALVLLALLFLAFGIVKQRRARRYGPGGRMEKTGGVSVHWDDINYAIPHSSGLFASYQTFSLFGRRRQDSNGATSDQTILDGVSGRVEPGEIMAILGPSGAGKTTLVEILAGKNKSGKTTGRVTFPSPSNSRPKIGFVPQQDVLPPTVTVSEALLFAARLRLPESLPDNEKKARVDSVMVKLGIATLRDVRIGYAGEGGSGGRMRGISGGEMRRVSIGLELVAKPDVLILDEPTSGLDSVSASKVAQVLYDVAHDPENPTAVIASIHQPSSQLYQTFDTVLVLAHGQTLYSGPGSFAPVEYFKRQAGSIPQYQEGYNVADYLLEVASDPPVSLFPMSGAPTQRTVVPGSNSREPREGNDSADVAEKGAVEANGSGVDKWETQSRSRSSPRGTYAATFLTQLEVLSGREWKILRRDKTLFWTHIGAASILGVFCGGLYFHTGTTIAGFQSRVGCLFFLGALIAFSSLSALYNVVEIRPLFLRERSSAYYSPTAWLLSRFIFDVIPLRLIPTIIVSTITYWMTGLAAEAAHFFKFLFILVLYTLAMTLFNFLLATFFRNGGIAILLSALSALYQMTFAGFFVHLDSIPPVLRWLQWLCPLKYTLEALSVNEVGSGLMIQDTLQGVPIDVSASLIMDLLFGFGSNNYYRDVLVLFAFIAGFGLGVIGVVWLKVRERR